MIFGHFDLLSMKSIITLDIPNKKLTSKKKKKYLIKYNLIEKTTFANLLKIS